MKKLFRGLEEEMRMAIFLTALVVSIAGVMLGITWTIDYYQSGIKAAVWKRQGIHLTQWEVFMGAKPICPHCYQGDTK